MQIRSLLAGVLVVLIAGGSARAQSLDSLRPGDRVRASGDRTALTGIERFSLTGRLVATDRAHIVIGRDGVPMADTIPFVGIKRLDVLAGYNSRSLMILTGAAAGVSVGALLWFGARQLAIPETTAFLVDQQGVKRGAVVRQSPIVTTAKVAIPILGVVGVTAGATLGREKWVRISVPGSIFDQKR